MISKKKKSFWDETVQFDALFQNVPRSMFFKKHIFRKSEKCCLWSGGNLGALSYIHLQYHFTEFTGDLKRSIWLVLLSLWILKHE